MNWKMFKEIYRKWKKKLFFKIYNKKKSVTHPLMIQWDLHKMILLLLCRHTHLRIYTTRLLAFSFHDNKSFHTRHHTIASSFHPHCMRRQQLMTIQVLGVDY